MTDPYRDKAERPIDTDVVLREYMTTTPREAAALTWRASRAPLTRILWLCAIVSIIPAYALLFKLVSQPAQVLTCVGIGTHLVIGIFVGMQVSVASSGSWWENRSRAEAFLIAAWAPIALPALAIWRVGRWIRTGE